LLREAFEEKRLVVLITLEQGIEDWSLQSTPSTFSLSPAIAGNGKLELVSDHQRPRRAHQQPQGERAHLRDSSFCLGITSSIRLIHRRRAPPQLLLTGATPVTISRGRCH
jgi:hypothetical protein